MHLCLIVLLCLVSFSGRGQSFADTTERDSIKQLVWSRVEAPPRQRILWLRRLARYTLTDKDTALYYTDWLAREAREADDASGQAYALFVRSLVALERGAYEQAQTLADRSLAYARNYQLDTIEGFALNTLAEIYHHRGDYLQARQHYIAADRVKRRIGDLKGRGITLYNQFDLALRINYLDEAAALVDSMAVVNAALQPDRPPEDNWIWQTILARLALGRGELEAAERHVLRVRELAEQQGFPVSRSDALLGRIYSKQGRYAAAAPLLASAVATLQRIGYLRLEMEAQLHLAENEWRQGRMMQAAARVDTVIAQTDVDANLDQAAHAQWLAAKIATDNGQPRRALNALSAHLELKDRILDRDKQSALLDAAARYDNELARARIAQLAQENELQRLTTEHRTSLLLYSAGLLILALLGVVLLYRTNRTVTRQSKVIERTAREKANLLQEMHHRTQNNLTIVQSLLLDQGRSLEDPAAIHAIAESSDRILSIGLIHQHLYEAGSGRWVHLPTYLETLCARLEQALIAERSIVIHRHVVDCDVAAAQTVYLGLLANELITNAAKHAFTDEPPAAAVWLRVDRQGGDLLLSVQDNGSGLPQEEPYRSALIELLVDQLAARLSVEQQDGLTVRVRLRAALRTTTSPALPNA